MIHQIMNHQIRPTLTTSIATIFLVAAAHASPAEVPSGVQACVFCHQEVVTTYLEHGMARSVGALGELLTGSVTHPEGRLYEIHKDADGTWLEASFPDGGRRRQRLVGRIGAGIFDTSWAAMEVDVVSGAETGRLFFAPVETISGHGHELSPFELTSPSRALDMALTQGCLTCHTTSRLEKLPGAIGAVQGQNLLPGNALGADAFEHLQGISCEDCHGDTAAHLQLMSNAGKSPDVQKPYGLRRLGELPPGAQRDVCARCHLQGDARIDMTHGALDAERPLAGQIPVVVPKQQGEGFRFVSQLERLVLSECFQATSEMTCTTCHAAHQGVRAQGIASFDASCQSCHECSSPAELTAQQVTGEPGRTAAGCVDCHVRRSQPFDLPHVRSADHFVRRRIPPPAEVPYRQFADLEGELEIFDDGRLAPLLASAEGRRWRAGV